MSLKSRIIILKWNFALWRGKRHVAKAEKLLELCDAYSVKHIVALYDELERKKRG